ncbi:MAG: permease [Spirochaetes bacterium GWF1_51_8]|nr:MAG: permease [Spirochaetes bacterium GWF1_51_8]
MVIQIIGFVALGLGAGVLSGMLGVGGAVFVIPALVMFYGFDQRLAQGTTLMMMVPPIGLLAALEYNREGFVDLRAALIMAAFFFVGGYIGSKFALKIDPLTLRRVFAVFLVMIAVRMWFK